MSQYIVAVHGGAGSHKPSSERTVKRALRLACTAALAALERGMTPIHATETAICELEDEESLNAGFGSNLTAQGTVECDASIMEGNQNGFGSVGAVAGVKNPIRLARAVMENASMTHKMGLIPPITLVGPGAHQFAASSGLDLVPGGSQVCDRAKADWERWKHWVDNAEALTSLTEEPASTLHDTVGAIVCDTNGSMAAGVSSGGILLKHSGRLGEAAAFGAGCWAHSPVNEPRGMACSVTGAGEQIMRASLAVTLADELERSQAEDVHDSLQKVIDKFYRSCERRGDPEASAGVLLITKDTTEAPTCRLWCAFTTKTMAVAYASSADRKPRAMVLRQPGSRESNKRPPIYITSLPLLRI